MEGRHLQSPVMRPSHPDAVGSGVFPLPPEARCSTKLRSEPMNTPTTTCRKTDGHTRRTEGGPTHARHPHHPPHLAPAPGGGTDTVGEGDIDHPGQAHAEPRGRHHPPPGRAAQDGPGHRHRGGPPWLNPLNPSQAGTSTSSGRALIAARNASKLSAIHVTLSSLGGSPLPDSQS